MIGLARKRRDAFEHQTIPAARLQEYLDQGWKVVRKNKSSYLINKPKRTDIALEDRVWMLLYKMGFPYLSGTGGAKLILDADAETKPTTQMDVLAQDHEVVLAIECRSQQARGRRTSLQEELAKHGVVRSNLARAANATASSKLAAVLALVTQNVALSKTDRERAKEQQIVLLDDNDLTYYELLVAQLGPAARYQFLADLVPGKPIPGLEIHVPAVKSKMGGYPCYTFSVSPEYLLKVAYVSHRAHGQGSDVAAYQRMVSKARLRKIARYISEPDSIFPTNIVVNLEGGKRAQFMRAKQELEGEFGILGWLTLRPSYRSAWIIDGQHRLFAYSGHPLAASSRLAVLAFDGLPGHVQQKLFIDINAEQKSVKKSLLQELYADLHKNSDDPSKRTQAVISEVIQGLNVDDESPLFDRILLADSVRTDTRCISLNSMFSALDRGSMFYGSLQNGVLVNPGPFWGKTHDDTRQRTIEILNAWLGTVRDSCPDWWDLGAAEGGGLAMNDGVAICLSVLRSVFDHVDTGRTRLCQLEVREVLGRLQLFAEALGDHFSSMGDEQRQAFRALRGNQGQTAGTRHAQKSIQNLVPAFQPEGLKEFLDREKAQTNERAGRLIAEIELLLARSIIAILKAEFGMEGDAWWYDGVPKPVRTMVTTRQEEDDNKAGSKEAYLDLIHYRSIITNNWLLFGSTFGYGQGSKDKRTIWLQNVNEIRKVVAHASRGSSVSFEQLSELENYLSWLNGQVGGEGQQGAADTASDPDTDVAPD
jgi:DGQHR domain-containing protein